VRVTVRLYAVVRERAGQPHLLLDLPDPATVGDLRRALAKALPAVAGILPHARIALGEEFADDATRIPTGVEASVIPPVSGGAPEGEGPDEGSDWITLTDEPIDSSSLLDRVRSRNAGAVCLFLGTVRERTGDLVTTELEYEAFPEMALSKLQALAAQARRQWPIERLAIVHRVGVLGLGEIAVVIAVGTPHRAEGFAACQWLMDSIKADVPIWKKERWADGREEWVHPGLDADAPPDGQ
jgi:molybdopterin synthase catalytic subunit/molybdopterin converting factor small subunit